MVELLNILSLVCLLLGSFCNLIAGIGIFFFPDLYTRMHAAGITDSLGTGLIIVGLMLLSGWDSALGKLFLILVFALITSPTISFILANSAKQAELQSESSEGQAAEEAGEISSSKR